MAIKHQLDRDKIFTKELDPKKTTSIDHIEYNQNIKGTFIVDKNENLSSKRRLVSLYTSTTSQENFTKVIDTEFAEFVDAVPEEVVDNTELEDLTAENSTLKRKVVRLDTRVVELETNILNYPVVVNQVMAANPEPAKVSDTMAVGSTLYSDRTGENGTPIQNRLLSKNKKARLTIQGDGNLVIVTGEFDELGNSKGPDEVVLSVGWDGGETAPAFFTVAWDSGVKINSYVAVGGLTPYYQHRWRTPGFKTSTQTRLVLDDFGNINLYDKDKLVWTSYGINIGDYFVSYNRPTTPNPVVAPTTPAPTPAPTPASPVINSTKMLKAITFKRSNGNDITLVPWVDTSGSETFMNVELITKSDGTKTVKFKGQAYMARYKNHLDKPRRPGLIMLSDEEKAWRSIIGDTLEATYVESEWGAFGPPIEVERVYKGNVAIATMPWVRTVISTGEEAGEYVAKVGGPISFKTYYPSHQPAQFVIGDYIYSRNFSPSEWNNLEKTVLI